MHLSEQELAALTHGDVSAPSGAALAHLVSCSDCSARLEMLRAADREVAGLLGGVDHVVPRVRGAAFVDALHARRRRVGAIAAGLAFCVAGAAAALPNSPLHHAILRVFSTSGSSLGRNANQVGNPFPPKPGVGVAFVPGSSLDVLFKNPRPGGRLRISLVDGPQVSATADGDAAFSIYQSQLEVNDHGVAMSFVLEIPRRVADVTVRTGSETILSKHANLISHSRPSDSTGAYTFEF